jgi:outer membrane lipoprotein carrier protein
MKVLVRFTTLILLLSVFSTVVSAESPVKELQDKLSSFHSMRANFQQTLYGDKREAARKSSGKVSILRPGKFRWDTQSPNEQVLIADGKTLWIYDVDLEQATKQKLDTTDSNSPALFLSGEVSDIPKRFNVNAEKSGEGVDFTLKAKASDDMFQSIKILFQANKLSKMVVGTRLGQRSEFIFTHVELNPTLPKATFNFKPPAGVDVLTN